MSLKVQQVQLKLSMDGKQALNELAALEQETDELGRSTAELKKKIQANEKALKDLEKGSDAYKKLKAETRAYSKEIDSNSASIQKNRLRIDELRKSGGDQLRLTSSLKKEQGELARSLQNLTVGTDKYNDALKRSKEIQKELDYRKGLAKPNAPKKSWMGSVKEQLPAAIVGGIAGAAVGAAGMLLGNLMGDISSGIEKLARKSDDITDLALSFQTSTEEAKELNKEIASIDNRLGPKVLRGIATEAGKLGVPTEEVRDYTEAVGQAAVAMEKDFPDGAEALTEKLTKIKGLYSDTKELKYADSVYKIGSAMKVLADDGTATAKWQSEFLLRMGQLPEKTRPAIKELMGLAAVLEEAGVTDDIAASGLTAVINAALKNSAGFGKLLGKSKEEFEEFINTKPNEFLLQLSEKLGKMSGTQAAQSLANLKVESQEAFKALGVLSNNIDKVRTKQQQASGAFEEGSRLTEIFSAKNDNLAGKMERAGTVISQSFNNSHFVKEIEKMTEGVVDLILTFDSAEKELDRLTTEFQQQTRAVENLTNNVSPLVERYDQLKSKSKLNKAEQAELKTIITQLSGAIPMAVSQFDQYGNAISINTRLAKEFIETEKARLRLLNEDAIDKWANRLKGAKQNVEALTAALNKRDEQGYIYREEVANIENTMYGTTKGTVMRIRLTNKEILQLQNNIKRLQYEAKGARAQIYSLTGTPLPGTKTEEKPAGDPAGNGLADFDPADLKKDPTDSNSKAEQAAKRELDLLNRLTSLRIKMLKSAEEREIAERSNQAAREMEELKLQEGDHTELLKTIEEERNYEIDQIHLKYAKEREKQVQDLQNRVVEATQRITEQRLQIDLADAQKIANNQEGIFNAQLAISLNQEQAELHRLSVQYQREREQYKDNAEALIQLEIDCNKQIEAIQEKYGNQRIDDEKARNKALKERRKQAKREELDLDVRAAEFSNNDKAILNAKLAFLDYMKAEELKVANLTEEEKTNIIRRYQLEREGLMRDDLQKTASKIVEYFQRGYDAISNLQAVSLQNEETQNNNSKERQSRRLDDQLKQGIISQEQYTAQKEQIDKKHEEKQRIIRRRQAEAEKKDALFRAGLEMGIQIIKSLSNPLQLAAAVFLGGAQIAAIANREIPEYYEGGRPPVAGHDGLEIRVNEKNKQEQILPNYQLVDPATAKYADWLEYRRAHRITGFRGPSPDQFGASSFGSAAPAAAPVIVMQQNDTEMKGLIRNLSEKGVQAHMSYRHMDDSTTRMQQIKNDAMA